MDSEVGRRAASRRWLAVLRGLVALVLVVDLVVVATHDDGADRTEVAEADRPARRSTTTTEPTTTTPTDAPVTTAAPPAGGEPAPTTTTTEPRSAYSIHPPPTVPPTVPTTPPTVPPITMPTTPSNTAVVLVENDYPGVLDVSINGGFLQMAAGGRHEALVLSDIGASNGQVPPGSDLVTASIPPTYGSPDAGCGSHSLAQLIAPGGRYVLRIFASGTCRLLGGSPKPAFRLTPR